MAVNITDENFYQYLEDGGEAIENRGQIPVMEEGEIDYTVSFPAVKYDKDPSTNSTAKAVAWRQVYWKTFWTKILEGYNMSVDATEDLVEIKTLVLDAVDAANAATAAATTATVGASNVDATLVGMTVTITDRNGQARSTKIGFDVYKTYSSVDAMKADAANVPEGKFVMIATLDATDPDNAQLWGRTAYPATDVEHAFQFLSDLDQASSAAWADWLNNMKPQITASINAANTAAALANTKAGIAQTAADNADASRIAIEANEQTRQTNEAARVAAETQRQTDWTNFFSDTLTTGCRYLWNNFWSSINSLWTGFWGTSADDPNGVRKQWSDLHTQATADHVQAENDHTRANLDHTIAESDHTTAGADHTTASSDHTQAVSDTNRASTDHTASETATTNANTQANRAKAWADHPPYIADGTQQHQGDLNYWYIWSESLNQYVKSPYAKGDDLHWEEMSEQEKDDLAQRVLDVITFASVETCEDIIDELT